MERTKILTSLLWSLLAVGLWTATAFAVECVCVDCHGTLEEVHGDVSHTSAPGSGTVALFKDFTHSNAAWTDPSPQFPAVADCTLCHAAELPLIHGKDCATCHPDPYETLGTWNKGCQQGGCHETYHTDSTVAHTPFENAYDRNANDCSRCHDYAYGGGPVPQSKCLNCHAAVVTGDISPPTTTSDARAEYDGPAEIKFSITDNGKVGVGRTFYKLDNGPKTAAGKSVTVPATALGTHQLEFWSMDQAGNVEATPHTVFFTIIHDTIPPTTTSDAKASYNQGATIKLTATDNSSRGVKATYYKLTTGATTGPTQTGTQVVIAPPSVTTSYTLTFWSEDWSGNLETQKNASFTVPGGGGTIRLIWGNSDTAGSPCPDIGDGLAASWIIGQVGSNKVLKSGSGTCPNWSGVNDVAISVSTKAYWVVIDYWDSEIEGFSQTRFPNVPITTSGQVVPLRY